MTAQAGVGCPTSTCFAALQTAMTLPSLFLLQVSITMIATGFGTGTFAEATGMPFKQVSASQGRACQPILGAVSQAAC